MADGDGPNGVDPGEQPGQLRPGPVGLLVPKRSGAIALGLERMYDCGARGVDLLPVLGDLAVLESLGRVKSSSIRFDDPFFLSLRFLG